MKERLLIIGSANVDLMLNTDVFPQAGESVVSEGNFSYVAGGKGAHAARLCAALGCDTIFLCRLGDDRHGNRMLDIYRKNGIDTRFITLDRKRPTGMSVVISCDGESRTIVYPGANTALPPSSVEEAFTTYPDGALIHMDIPDEAIAAAGHFAKKTGARLIVDAASARSGFRFEKAGGIDTVVLSEADCLAYSGIEPGSADSCRRACIDLGEKMKAKGVVLKLGPRGAFVYDGTYNFMIPAYRVKSVDPTGVGDAFTAALAARLIRGDSLEAAARFANAAGAIATMHRGAYAPREEEINTFMSEQEI